MFSDLCETCILQIKSKQHSPFCFFSPIDRFISGQTLIFVRFNTINPSISKQHPSLTCIYFLILWLLRFGTGWFTQTIETGLKLFCWTMKPILSSLSQNLVITSLMKLNYTRCLITACNSSPPSNYNVTF